MNKTNGQIERPLPVNLEAERSVLGAVLLDNNCLARAQDAGIVEEDFFLFQNRLIYCQMVELRSRAEAIDLVTMTESLHKTGELEAAGGAPYISSLADGMPKVSNVEHYAKIVKEKAVLRSLIHATHNIQQHAFEEETSTTVLEEARAAISALIQLQPQGGLVAMKNIVNENFEKLEKIFTAGRNVTGLATGYSGLDHLTAGLQQGELTILAARPSIGKTSLALNIAENVAVRAGQPVAFFSLEMSKESLLQRMIASVAQIDAHKFRTGHLSREDWRRMTEALGSLAAAPMWVDDSSSSTIGQIAARAERHKREHGLALVVVDYLQLVGAIGRTHGRQEEVSSVSRGLKALAKDLSVPVLALSQLTRAPDRDDRAPMLSDLRESGAIEQDADVVAFIHRPHFNKSGASPEEREETHLNVAKQRNGPTDTVRFVFRSRLTRFEEAAPEAFDMFDERNE